MPTSLPSPPDPFQTPIQSTSLLPNLEGQTRRVAASTLPLQDHEQSEQFSRPAQLGEPISLGREAVRGTRSGSKDGSSSNAGDVVEREDDLTSACELDGNRGLPNETKAKGRGSSKDLFYTTPARRASPPTQRANNRDQTDINNDSKTEDHCDTQTSKTGSNIVSAGSDDDHREGSRFSHPASTPYDRDGDGISLLTSEIGGSPAYTDIRTPGVDSSVGPIGRRMGRIVRRQGGRFGDDDEDENEDEEAGGKDAVGDDLKGVHSRTKQPVGLPMISRSTTSSALAHALLSTPAPRTTKLSSSGTSGAMGFKDVSTVFPFALSTPQNSGRRGVDDGDIDEEVPVQSQPLAVDARRRNRKDEEEDEGVARESATDDLLPPTPLGRSFVHPASSSMLTTPHPRDRISRSTYDLDGEDDQDEANTPGSSSLTSTGKKRRRTSPQELKVLEEAYERNQLPTSEERVRLADRTGMSTRAVQIWFQNKRQTEKRKLSQRVYPTMMLVPLRHGGPSNQGQPQASTSASGAGQTGSIKSEHHPSSDHDHEHRVHSSSPFSGPMGVRKSAERNGSPAGMSGYQYVPVTASGSAAMLGGNLLDDPSKQGGASMMIIGKGKRAVLPGDEFFSRTNAGGVAAKVLDRDEDGLGVETEVDEDGDHVDEVDSGDEDDRGRSREAVLPTSDVRSSSPALNRSSSPGALLKERQQLKRRGSSADDKMKEDAKKKERLMLFPSSSSIAVSDEVMAASASQASVMETPRADDRSIRSVSTPKTQEISKPTSLKRSTSERMPGSAKRQIIGIADISSNMNTSGGQAVDASPSAPFGGRRFVVTQSVPSFSVRKEALFAKPISPLGKRKYSRYSSGGFSIRAEPTNLSNLKSFGRSQSGILDEMCSRKELPFMLSSMRKEHAEPLSALESSEAEDHVKVESEIMLSQNKTAMAENSLLDLLPSDPPSMGLIDMNSDAENAPYEGDTDVEETPKKKTKTFDGSHGPGMRHFASLDYFAGSPSKRKGLLGDESRRLSGLGTARRRLFEAHLQQQAQQRAAHKGKKQQGGKKKKPTTSSLKRSSSSSSASIALATIAATPKRKGLSNTRSMPDLALVASDKINITPGRKVPIVAKDGKAEQQTDEEAARLLLGLFGGR